MRCPACQQPATETTDECACGFSLALLDKQLGIAPALHGAVNDTAQILVRREVRTINHEIERLERVFPQLRFVIVTCQVPDKATLPTYAFWLFNRSGITAATERGSQNRLVMLVLDASHAQAACMIGYGLEPFVSEARITSALNAALALLSVNQLGGAVLAFLTEMEKQLADCVNEMPGTFGIGGFEFQGVEHLLDSQQSAAVIY